MKETRFKDTEIGKVPVEWDVETIGNITQVSSGGTPSSEEESFWGGEIPWMNSGELNLKIVADVEGRITEKGLQYSSTHWIPKECVLIGLAGQGKTRGTAAYNLIPLCTNQSIGAIYPCENFHSKYVYYFMDSRYLDLRALSDGGGGRGGLTKALLEQYSILLPPLPEQRRIASVLTDVDALIASLDQLIEKKRSIKQGAMQQLLTGKTRLKGCNEPWVEKKLGDCLNSITSGMFIADTSTTTLGFKVYGGNGWTGLRYPKYNATNSSIVVGRVGALCGNIHLLKEKAWITDNALVLRPSENNDSSFLYYLLQHHNLNKLRTGNAQPLITGANLLAFEIQIPIHIAEQRAIARLLTDMDGELATLEQKRAKYAALKDGMMQQLLTGNIRFI